MGGVEPWALCLPVSRKPTRRGAHLSANADHPNLQGHAPAFCDHTDCVLLLGIGIHPTRDLARFLRCGMSTNVNNPTDCEVNCTMIKLGLAMQDLDIRLMIATLVIAASLGTVSCVSSGSASTAGATQPSAADERLAEHVQAALHADPYLYDKHIQVSIEHGDVALRGFVANAEDLVSAKKIAFKAAGGRRVVDYLSINPIEQQDRGPRP